MGSGQVQRPLLGKEGVGPAVMVPAAAFSTGAFAQDRTQPHSQPAVDAVERVAVAVLEVLKPPRERPVHIGDDERQALAAGPSG